ncbi:unconventional prefoldin RPB5 interactor isoform X2 [Parasteatoda tepidariorum]|uniref:unconventional prefoldin RPB5 interactor isoform X2 n=1 Tax=Parasteatoda tepidariorum TaxID=114398 RepID=UPI0039BC9A63
MNKSLQLCEEKIKQWEKFKSDYQVLKQQLQSLPNEVSYDITVPFGPNAFSMGKLVHTNEVMVLLGDNWFAEVSGKQAAEIADRRIAQCDKMLDDLSKEKNQFENWLSYIGEVCNDDLVEIVEEYDEEKEKEWRIQHSKNVKAYRQKISQEAKHNHSNGEDGDSNLDDDEFIAKLESLELMETSENRELSDLEENDEISLSKELSESEGNDSEISPLKELSESDGNGCEIPSSKGQSDSFTDISRSDDIELQLEEEKSSKTSLRLNINCTNDLNSVHETESGDDEDGSKSDDVNANLENCNAGSHEKHVRWQDLSKQSIKKITFKHSRSKHHNHSKHQIKRQDSSESDEPQPLIQSPSDIYKHFGSFFQASSPKSILKVKNSPSTPDGNETFFPVDDMVPNDSSPDLKSENIVNAFTGKVYERSSPIHIPEKKSSSRPSSHFKNTRKNRRR